MAIRISAPAEGVCCLLLDRRPARNAIDLDTVVELSAAVADVAGAVETVRALVLGSATPGMFSAGADLKISDNERAKVSDQLYSLYGALLALPVPVIVAIDGAAVGGGAQLALSADVRYGSRRARFKFAGPGHGLAVGLWALPSLIGRGRAMATVLAQEFVGAEEARAAGLLDGLVDDPLAAALALGERTAGLDPAAVARAKRLVVDGERLAARLSAERAGNASVFTGEVPRIATRGVVETQAEI